MLHIAVPVSTGKLQSSLVLSCSIFLVRNWPCKVPGVKGPQLLVYIYRDSTSFSDLLTLVISLTHEDILQPYKEQYFQFHHEPLVALGYCIIVCYSPYSPGKNN